MEQLEKVKAQLSRTSIGNNLQVWFKKRNDAVHVLSFMRAYVRIFGRVTIKDLYEVIEGNPGPSDSRYGWENLEDLVISPNAHAIHITFPPTRMIDDKGVML